MLPSKSWIYGALSTDAGILAVLGSDGVVTDAWPEVFDIFPVLIYTDENQLDFEFADNLPTGTELKLKIDIFTKIEGALPTTTDIGMAVANFFKPLFFTCSQNGEVPDDTVGVRHRVMVFTREVFALESI